ncbi:MAG: competence protein ComFB [Clostridia bacterium]|jgi:competence protein ComFB|nr:hypothetical protein [Clostridiales bacterium]MDK2985233.1 competence protein ComFB [Clostridia bacterium]
MKDKNSKIILKNCMEDIVWPMINEVLAKNPDICNCEICVNDIAALTLNELPPKYVAREKGEVFSRTSILENQYRADVYAAISRAMDKVKKEPRHYE